MWGYHDDFGWWMLFGGIGMVLFWGVLLWFAVVVSRNLFGRAQSDHRETFDEAESIIRRRFASGEITEEEFQRATDALRDRRRGEHHNPGHAP
jgi:putative membrane protein